MNKGFTLIELSIVLVIIGLLVGGILSAKSMISTAKTQKVIGQVQQLDIAVSNFKEVFSALPGDSPGFTLEGDFSLTQSNTYGSNYLHGDNNGYINYATEGTLPDYCSNSGLGCNHFVGEIANFYVQLGQTNYYPGKFKADIPPGGFNSDSQNLNAPSMNIAGTTFQLIPLPCVRPNYNNCYQAADYRGVWPGNYIASAQLAFTPQVIAAIDVKMDDGKPLSGIISNQKLDEHPDQSMNECNDYWSNGHNEGTAKYIFSADFCNISFGMLTQVSGN